MSFQRLAWLLALTGFEFTTQKQGYFGVKSKHSPFIDTLIVSQGTVPSLIPCKNLSVRRLLWLRRRYLLSTITVCRLPFKTAPTSWTVTRTCDRMINDIKYSLRFEIQPIQKKSKDIVCDGDVSCFPILPFAEATPECAMLLSWIILKVDSSLISFLLNDSSTKPKLIEIETDLN